MQDMIYLLRSQIEKMNMDGSWYVGLVAGAVSFTIPTWVTQKEWTFQHTVLILILSVVIVLEWAVGGRLAKLSPVTSKSSGVAIDAVIRDALIFAMCGIAYGFDYLIDTTGSAIFVLFTGAFIYHNLYSLLANIEVLGWGKHFPIWLMKWLDNEIQLKTKKYFPNKKEEEK